MRIIKLVSGVVDLMTDLAPGQTIPDGWVALPDGSPVGPGWTFDGEEYSPPPPPPQPRRLIAKSTVQERVNTIGKLDEVLAVLNSQSIFFARWFAPDWPNVYFDDEGLLTILAAVGCTPAEIETITAP